jgi:Rha family phage regulatory protein
MTNALQQVEVSLVDGRPMVSSLKVAEHFGKKHYNVIRAIKSLKIPDDFRALNFEGTSYKDVQGKERPVYLMTRDGFTLLVMGFTGKRAMEWKIKYIEAFNAMEKKLLEEKIKKQSLDEPSTSDDRRALRMLIQVWVYKLTDKPRPADYKAAWRQVLAHLNVPTIEDLPKERIPEAIRFVQTQINTINYYKIMGSSSLPEGKQAEQNTSNLPAVQDFDLLEVQSRIGELRKEARNFLLSMERYANEIVGKMEWDRVGNLQASEANRIVLEMFDSMGGLMQAIIHQLNILARQRKLFAH